MSCKYFENCKHHSGWCNSDTALIKCTYGLNNLCSEQTWKIVELEDEIAKLRKYINQLDEEQKSIDEFSAAVQEEYKREIAELKRLLRLAVEDFERFRYLMSSDINEEFCETALEYHCNPYDLCNSCPLSGSVKCKWKHAEEALRLIGDDKNANENID